MSAVYGNLGKEVMEKAFSQIKAEKQRKTDIKKQKELEAKVKNEESKIVKFAGDVSARSNIKVEDKPHNRFSCTCPLCQAKKPYPTGDVKEEQFFSLDFEKKRGQEKDANEKSFSFLLKSLIPDRGNLVKGFKFLIADTLIFQNGDPKFVIYNSGDKLIRFMKSRDKMTLTDMRKFFQERKRRKDSHGLGVFYENNITIRNQIQAATNRNSTLQDTDNAGIVVDGNERREKGIKSKRIMEENTSHRDCVLVRYRDDAIQVLSELEFSYFMMKRKIEPIWKEIDYMQIYTKMKKEHNYLIKVEFKHMRDRHNPLYDKAANYIYYMQEDRDIDIDGFSQATEEDYLEEKLKKTNQFEYCQYLTYKLVCYLDSYCKTRVKEMIAEFAWEDTDLVYLVNAYRIFFYNLAQVTDYALRHVNIVNQEERQQYLEKIAMSPYKGKLQLVYAFQEYMDENYSKIKQETKADKELQEDSMMEQRQSDEAFKEMNPEVSFTLNEVLTNEEHFNKFKQWLAKRGEMIGDQAIVYRSALRYAQGSRAFEKIGQSTLKANKSTMNMIKMPQVKKVAPTYDSGKNFTKKLKALDICGNGFSNKKYINASEVNYHADMHELNKFKSPTNQKTISISRGNESRFSPEKFSMSTDFRTSGINSTKSSRPATAAKQQNVPKKISRIVSMKQKSLTSIIYQKALPGEKLPDWNAPNYF